MNQLLALASAVMFGLGDFTGGIATRRAPVWTVVLWSQIFGVTVLAVAFWMVPVGEVTAADVAYGALGGAAGVLGIGILYTALARGEMSVVAPITGATTATLPVLFDLGTGHGLASAEWLGIGLGIGAVVLLGLDVGRGPLGWREFGLAVAAGVAFAAFFVALAQTDEASGLWPVVGVRAVSLPLAAVTALALGQAARPTGRTAGLAATAGSLDMVANVALVLAVQRGSLAVSSVLSSLYPAVTALAAITVLRERPTPVQAAGIAVAIAAVAALAA